MTLPPDSLPGHLVHQVPTMHSTAHTRSPCQEKGTRPPALLSQGPSSVHVLSLPGGLGSFRPQSQDPGHAPSMGLSVFSPSDRPISGPQGSPARVAGTGASNLHLLFEKKIACFKTVHSHDLKYRLGTRREAMKASTRVRSRALGWAQCLSIHADSRMIHQEPSELIQPLTTQTARRRGRQGREDSRPGTQALGSAGIRRAPHGSSERRVAGDGFLFPNAQPWGLCLAMPEFASWLPWASGLIPLSLTFLA